MVRGNLCLGEMWWGNGNYFSYDHHTVVFHFTLTVHFEFLGTEHQPRHCWQTLAPVSSPPVR